MVGKRIAIVCGVVTIAVAPALAAWADQPSGNPCDRGQAGQHNPHCQQQDQGDPSGSPSPPSSPSSPVSAQADPASGTASAAVSTAQGGGSLSVSPNHVVVSSPAGNASTALETPSANGTAASVTTGRANAQVIASAPGRYVIAHAAAPDLTAGALVTPSGAIAGVSVLNTYGFTVATP